MRFSRVDRFWKRPKCWSPGYLLLMMTWMILGSRVTRKKNRWLTDTHHTDVRAPLHLPGKLIDAGNNAYFQINSKRFCDTSTKLSTEFVQWFLQTYLCVPPIYVEVACYRVSNWSQTAQKMKKDDKHWLHWACVRQSPEVPLYCCFCGDS